MGVKLTEDTLVPVVILKAAGEQANQVVQEARGLGDIPIVRSPELTSQLYRIPLDRAVTPDLFPIMAALLAHVVQVDKVRQAEEFKHE